jgi:soluble lytic murein transglycosylase-like protein
MGLLAALAVSALLGHVFHAVAPEAGPAIALVPSQEPALPEAIHVPPEAVAPVVAGAERYAELVDAASSAHGVEAELVHAVIFAESSYDARAVSSAGASGLMQLMPETAKRHGVRDVFDPADNIRGGVKHLKLLLELFKGNVELAVAAYNAGENAVIRAGNRIPPYPQTARYVPKVIGHYRGLRAHRP